MTMYNAVPSEIAAIIGVIDPDEYAAATLTTGWFKADKFDAYMGIISIGALGTAGTIQASMLCATAAAGTNAKAVSAGKTSATLSDDPDFSDKQVVINLRASELPAGYDWIALTATTVGAAASDVSGVLLGFGPRGGGASRNDSANVVSILT